MAARPLTSGEMKLARSVFGDSIDYGTVRVSPEKFGGMDFLPEGTAMAPNGNLFMPGCYCNDYSAKDIYTQGLFIHEMTHVWQYQNKVLAPIVEAAKLNVKYKFNYNAAYAYALDAKKDLLDYNMEQQASIVQDYFVLKHKPVHDVGEKQLFEKVLKNFIADPAYAKQAAFPSPFGLRKRPKP